MKHIPARCQSPACGTLGNRCLELPQKQQAQTDRYVPLNVPSNDSVGKHTTISQVQQSSTDFYLMERTELWTQLPHSCDIRSATEY